MSNDPRTVSVPKAFSSFGYAGAAPDTPASENNRRALLHWPAWWPSSAATYGYSLALVVTVGALLRFHGIEATSLNFDEGATSYFAHLPLDDLWGAPARLETNPPFFYMVTHGAMLLFGDRAGTLRLTSVLAGILCIPMAAFIARELGGRAAGLVAASLVATSTTSIVSSQDARAYSMFTLAALIVIAAKILLLNAYRYPVARNGVAQARLWAIYVVAGVMALYLHNTAGLMVVAVNLAGIVCWVGVLGMQRRFAAHWTAANAVVVAFYAFWLPVLAFQSAHTLTNFWIPVPTLMDLRYAVMNIYAQPYMRTLQPLPDALFLAAGLAGVVFHRSNRVVLGLAVFVVLAVPALSWLASQWRPIMNGKTLLWLVPVFLILVALGCTRFQRLAIPLTALLVVVQVVACHTWFQTRWDEAFPELVTVLRDKAQAGDSIYLDSPSDEILLSYYGWPRDRLKVYAPSAPDKWFRGFDGVLLAASSIGQVDHGRRMWVLTRANRSEHRSLAERLGRTMTEVFDRTFGYGVMRNMPMRNLELSLFVAKPEQGIAAGGP